jgi:hypothetical protein
MPLAPSVVHVPSLVRVAASRVITRMRLIEAIRPTTRKADLLQTSHGGRKDQRDQRTYREEDYQEHESPEQTPSQRFPSV